MILTQAFIDENGNEQTIRREVMSAEFPEMHWFHNTPENAKAFLERFPGVKSVAGRDINATWLEEYSGSSLGRSSGNFAIAASTGVNWFKDNGYTEYKFEKPDVQPKNCWFHNTPENVAEFARRWPEAKWKCKEPFETKSTTYHKEPFFAVDDRGRLWLPSSGDLSNIARLYFEHELQRAESLRATAVKSFEDAMAASTLAIESGRKTLGENEYIIIPKGRLDDARKVWWQLDEYVTKYGVNIQATSMTREAYFYTAFGGEPVWCDDPSWFESRHPSKKEVAWERLAPWKLAKSPLPSWPGAPEIRVANRGKVWTVGEHVFAVCGASPVFSCVPVDSVSEEKDMLSKTEMTEIAKLVATEMKTPSVGGFTPKPGIARQAAGFTWGATKSTFNWVFGPVKKLSQIITCVAAMSGLGYGGYQTYNWVMKNVSIPTVTWEKADSSPSDRP